MKGSIHTFIISLLILNYNCHSPDLESPEDATTSAFSKALFFRCIFGNSNSLCPSTNLKISYPGSPFTFVQGVPITNGNPTISGSTPSKCTVTPDLPAGLSIENSTCNLSGTPTALQNATKYSITAYDTLGKSSSEISIAVRYPIIYVGTSGGISISKDNGTTYTNNALGGSVSVTGIFVIDSNIYLATDTGVWISNDSGATYTKYVSGLTSVNALGIYVSGTYVYVATQSTGGALATSSDGGKSYMNRTFATPNVTGVQVSGTNIYVSTRNVSNGGIAISTDSGGTFSLKNTASNGLASNVVNGLFVSGSKIYAGTLSGLSISSDGGNSFNTITTSNGLGDNNVNGIFVNGSTVYTATDAGLSISTNGGSTFTNNNFGGSVNALGVYVLGGIIYSANNTGFAISRNSGTSYSIYTTANGLGNNFSNTVFVN